jgi:hypothetical protein
VRKKAVRLVVHGFAGKGTITARANVGKVEAINETRGQVELSYRCPPSGSPQRLLILLWRPMGAAGLVRAPISAWTEVDVKTKRGRNVQVRVKVGSRMFGPVMSGRRRHVKLRVLVPPGVATVEAEASRGEHLVTRRSVALPPLKEETLVVGVRKHGSRARGDLRYDVFAAGADREPTVELVSPNGTRKRLPLLQLDGAYTTAWKPDPKAPAGNWRLALASGEHRLGKPLRVAAAPAPPPAKPPTKEPSRLRLSATATIGLQHNFGELLSPLFGAEIAADWAMSWGYVGLYVGAGFAFDGQDISQGSVQAENSLMVVPIEFGARYTSPLFSDFFLAVSAGGLLQIVRSSSRGDLTGEVSSTELAWGFSASMGAGYRLGLGALVVRVGYRYAKLDTEDLALQAGGLLTMAGYRFFF